MTSHSGASISIHNAESFLSRCQHNIDSIMKAITYSSVLLYILSRSLVSTLAECLDQEDSEQIKWALQRSQAKWKPAPFCYEFTWLKKTEPNPHQSEPPNKYCFGPWHIRVLYNEAVSLTYKGSIKPPPPDTFDPLKECSNMDGDGIGFPSNLDVLFEKIYHHCVDCPEGDVHSCDVAFDGTEHFVKKIFVHKADSSHWGDGIVEHVLHFEQC